jgi:glycosyltransferase involved in cell wall biosynthesis
VKITAYLHSCPPLRTVGGEMMTLRLLAHSAEQGHDVTVIVRELDEDRMFGKVKLMPGHTASHQDVLKALNEADLLVTHPEIAAALYRFTSRITSTPSVGIIHNLGKRNLSGLLQRPNMAVIANSHETARLLIEGDAVGERPITVIHPLTVPSPAPVEGLPRAFCTHVNLSPAKGAGVLHRLVRDLPKVPFLAVVGGYGEQQVPKNDNGNVTLYGHFSGLGLPFGLTRVFMAPSRDETYGMTVCEATALGIPVIASDIPAHREALGDSPTYVAVNDYDEWAFAVELLMTDDRAWAEAHERAMAYADVLRERDAASYAKWDQLVTYLATSPAAQ